MHILNYESVLINAKIVFSLNCNKTVNKLVNIFKKIYNSNYICFSKELVINVLI